MHAIRTSIFRMRRSERHEADIAALAADVRESADRARAHSSESSVLDSPSVAARQWRAHRSTSEATSGRSPIEARRPVQTPLRAHLSPSARMPWSQGSARVASPRSGSATRMHSLRSAAQTPADLGEEYVHSATRRMQTLALERAATPQSTRRVTAPASMSPRRPEPEALPPTPQTANLHLALEQWNRVAPTSALSPEVCDKLAAAVDLAETVNLGLRRTIQNSLEVRMSLALQPSHEPEENMVDTLDVNLSELLKYSNDHVRSLTDTLILLTREERERTRAHARTQPTSPPIPPLQLSPLWAARAGRSAVPGGRRPDLDRSIDRSL